MSRLGADRRVPGVRQLRRGGLGLPCSSIATPRTCSLPTGTYYVVYRGDTLAAGLAQKPFKLTLQDSSALGSVACADGPASTGATLTGPRSAPARTTSASSRTPANTSTEFSYRLSVKDSNSVVVTGAPEIGCSSDPDRRQRQRQPGLLRRRQGQERRRRGRLRPDGAGSLGRAGDSAAATTPPPATRSTASTSPSPPAATSRSTARARRCRPCSRCSRRTATSAPTCAKTRRPPTRAATRPMRASRRGRATPSRAATASPTT